MRVYTSSNAGELDDCQAELRLSAKINSRLVEENKIMREALELLKERQCEGCGLTEFSIDAAEALGKCNPIKTAQSEDK